MIYFGGIKARVVGIVGGLGPETTSKFYLDLIARFRRFCKFYPRVVIDSISFPFSIEEEIIVKSRNEQKLFPILVDSIKRLNRAQVDFIVIPCNTIHVFIEKLRSVSTVPILSVVEETVKLVKRMNYKKVGLLATTKTIDNKLYEKPLKENDIEVIFPAKREQKKVSKLIVKILRSSIGKNDRQILKKTIDVLSERGAEAIVLGCADLQLVLNQISCGLEIVDSLNILLQTTFNTMLYKNNL